MIGKEIRMERIINRNTGKTVIVPMNHGVASGPIPGITDLRRAMSQVAFGGANAVIVHKGIVSRGHRKVGPDMGLIIHLSGSLSMPHNAGVNALVCTVEEAIKLGADAVSVNIDLGNGGEREMMKDLGAVSQTAAEWGMPLVAMVSPQKAVGAGSNGAEAVRHAARLGAELGADVVRVPYTGDPESFHKVVEGCDAPVVTTGGAVIQSDRAVLEMAYGAIQAGASGVSIGRNVFQRKDPSNMVTALAMIVHDGVDVTTAMNVLRSETTTAEVERRLSMPC